MAAGLPGLTPEPPPLPGGQLETAAAASTSHPAQPAAKKLVKDHSGTAMTTGNTSQPQAAGTTNAQSTPATEEPAKKEKKRFWQK